ncbi:hypothetical protein QL285_093575 [Trifolium repens]|nr:hypothetical protein QL285_093575 [Trifolium repens]
MFEIFRTHYLQKKCQGSSEYFSQVKTNTSLAYMVPTWDVMPGGSMKCTPGINCYQQASPFLAILPHSPLDRYSIITSSAPPSPLCTSVREHKQPHHDDYVVNRGCRGRNRGADRFF